MAATTVYISQTATNGYAAGNDSNTYAQMQNKATPALTLKGAISKILSTDTATIIINDGTYTENGYVQCGTHTGMVINAENDYMAIIRNATSSDTRVLHCPNGIGAAGLTLGKIVIDCYNVTANIASCITGDSSTEVPSLTINGTKLINFTGQALTFSHLKNLTMSGNWEITSSSLSNNSYDYAMIITVTNAASIVSISEGTIAMIAPIAVSGRIIQPITLVATIARATCEIYNNTINMGAINTTNSLKAIYLTGFTSYKIYNNIINETSLHTGTSVGDGINVNISNNEAGVVWVYDNTINNSNIANAAAGGGHGIMIGSDSNTDPGATKNSLNGVWVYGNTINYSNHGILFGWITGALCQGNNITKTAIGIIGKQTNNCKFISNIITSNNDCSSGMLRAKAGNGDIFANNICIVVAGGVGSGAISMLADSNSVTSTASTGIKFYNNIVYSAGVSNTIVNVATGSDATFKTNNYYSTVGYTGNVAIYTSTTYTSLTTYKAAVETTALNIDPKFVSYPNDLRVGESTLYHAGNYAFNSSIDYKGRPFYCMPTIGAYEKTSGDIAQTRLSRL